MLDGSLWTAPSFFLSVLQYTIYRYMDNTEMIVLVSFMLVSFANPEDRDMFLRNVGCLPTDYTAL
jgi:hypothetical protein